MRTAWNKGKKQTRKQKALTALSYWVKRLGKDEAQKKVKDEYGCLVV